MIVAFAVNQQKPKTVYHQFQRTCR